MPIRRKSNGSRVIGEVQLGLGEFEKGDIGRIGDAAAGGTVAEGDGANGWGRGTVGYVAACAGATNTCTGFECGGHCDVR
jgi:hypothetical protein